MIQWQWLIVVGVLGLGLGAAIGFAAVTQYMLRRKRLRDR